MLIEDAFNAVPADARCDICRHYAAGWCEVLDKKVKYNRWCRDFQREIFEEIKRKAEKSVENS